MTQNRIKAVLFDVDGVLLDSKLANATYYQDFLELHGYKRPTRQECDDVFPLDVYSAIKKLTNESSEEKLKALFAEVPGSTYPRHLLRIQEGAQLALDNLRIEYRLGIVTSRIKDGLYEDLGDLVKYFDTIISYEDSKERKPSPQPLLVAANRMKLKPDDIVYVGDADVDVAAARSAGMQMIGFGDKKLEGADITVTSFSEIQQVLKEFEKG